MVLERNSGHRTARATQAVKQGTEAEPDDIDIVGTRRITDTDCKNGERAGPQERSSAADTEEDKRNVPLERESYDNSMCCSSRVWVKRTMFPTRAGQQKFGYGNNESHSNTFTYDDNHTKFRWLCSGTFVVTAAAAAAVGLKATSTPLAP